MSENSRGPFPFGEDLPDDEIDRLMARDHRLIPTGGKVVVRDGQPPADLPASHRGRSFSDLASQVPLGPDVIAPPSADQTS